MDHEQAVGEFALRLEAAQQPGAQPAVVPPAVPQQAVAGVPLGPVPLVPPGQVPLVQSLVQSAGQDPIPGPDP